MEDRFIKLTNAVYRVLEFFPESDPLKNRAKEKALSVMESLSLIFGTDGWASLQKEKVKISVLGDIDILLSYLKIAEKQGWMSSLNYLIISYQYEKIKGDMGHVSELTLKLPKIEEYLKDEKVKELETKKPKLSDFLLNERQIKILEFLKEKESAQVMDLQTVLTNVTKRTIRRDLDELLTEGKIVRSGEFNQIFYKMNQ